MPPDTKFLRGAIPTPKHILAAAPRHELPRAAIPAQVAYVPSKLSMWGNDRYGDCVSAEEAFNKAACGNFISETEVIAWAKSNGYLNGAGLVEVMDSMAKSGFSQDSHVYGDGGYKTVDYSNEQVLQSALAIAPVKIGIDANALPSGAGNQMGWYAFGGKSHTNEDHCVALAGYGPAGWLFQQLGVTLPAGVDANKGCYLLFTWSTIGVVDHDWIMSTVGEAWVRDPSSTVDGNPEPNPGPKPVPAPTVKVTVTPPTVNYGDDVRVDVVATNAALVVCAGQTLPAEGGSFALNSYVMGTNQLTAVATGVDGSKVTDTATFTVVAPPPPPPPPAPTPVNNDKLTWVIIGLGVVAVGVCLYLLLHH